MSDTLACGHPAKYTELNSANDRTGCAICNRDTQDTLCFAAEICSLPDWAFLGFMAFRSRGASPWLLEVFQSCQAIVDDPDSFLPRLVFADWLDEQGDPRGELIRVESELAEDDNCSYCHGRGEIINHNGEGSLCPACYGEKKVMRPPGRSRCKCEQCQRYKDLLDRRTALRRQLGYDQPAEPEEVPCYDCRGTGIASRLGTGGVCIECDGTGKVRINA